MNLALLISLLILCLFPLFTNAAYPQDEIFLTSFNQSFWLKNETYTFQLIPSFNVPLQVLRHTIYTGSTNTVSTIGKRFIMENQKELYDVSPEDYQHLHRIMMGEVPEVVRVDKKKRSLSPLLEGVHVIRIAPKVAFFHTSSSPSKKRQDASGSIGTEVCIQVPFFTTCDNTPDLTAVKAALQASVDEIHSELDSYKKTNDARMTALSVALNTQRGIIDNILAETSVLNTLVGKVASSIQVNAAQIADGDFQAHSQINFLKRTTNALLQFSNALASTDPRTVVAQPSISKLFSGYKYALASLVNETYLPIVDTRTFNWQETILPSQACQNTSTNQCLQTTPATCQVPKSMSVNARVTVFTAILNAACQNNNPYPTVPACIPPSQIVLEPGLKGSNWIYGPFHKSHYGIYPVTVTTDGTTMQSAYVIQPIIQPSTYTFISGNQTIAIGLSGNTNSYCVQFLGYTMLASVSSTFNNLLNGINPIYVDPSNCDAYRLLEGSGLKSNTIYNLYAESEGVVIPFYSSCDIGPLLSDLNTLLGSTIPNTVSTINYVCSNAWSPGVPSNCGGNVGSSASTKITGVDVFLQHWVSPNCYINIEPSWLDLNYYVNPPLAYIPNIPRGYLMNQFTINPDGELASSLQFVYTTEWAQTYTIRRISQNTLIADEVTLLEGSPVLFRMDQSEVVDESDSFFGEGNNGRDCIHQSATYDYNLLNCFYQNDNQAYTANQYLTGLVTTTGIARYVNKFDFQLDYSTSGVYTFTLVPQDDAEFSFSIQHDSCPELDNQESDTNGCLVSLFHIGSDPVTLIGTNTSFTIEFTNYSSNFFIGFDTWSVQNAGRTCFFLECHYTSTYSTVKLVTPPFQLISASDLALQTEVSFSIAKTLNWTIQSMQGVLEEVSQANRNISELRERLAAIDFNMTALFPYENVTGMRLQLQNAINKIGDQPTPTTQQCSGGPWSSPQCWFENFAGALIMIAVVIVCLVVGYFVCVKGDIVKKVFGEKAPPPQMAVYSGD